MERLNIAICEDEQTEYEKILALLSDSGFELQHEYFANGEALIKAYSPGKYDLLLLDVYMEGLNGIETAAKIRQADPSVPMAFLTTSKDHALDGYRVHADRYLVKPIQSSELRDVLALAKNRRMSEPSIPVSFKGKECLVPLSHIRYVESHYHSLFFYLTGAETLQSLGKLSDLAQSLPSPPFYHCHKSFIVNLNHVSLLNKEFLLFEMKEGGQVYIRRKSAGSIEKAYLSYMFELTRRQETS
ncbi:MAG: response regulator transcription factor [Lachnospiraceae bacterium]|nr:response regulator transcription factor [Lachnospiraceae bacterium]